MDQFSHIAGATSCHLAKQYDDIPLLARRGGAHTFNPSTGVEDEGWGWEVGVGRGRRISVLLASSRTRGT